MKTTNVSVKLNFELLFKGSCRPDIVGVSIHNVLEEAILLYAKKRGDVFVGAIVSETQEAQDK